MNFILIITSNKNSAEVSLGKGEGDFDKLVSSFVSENTSKLSRIQSNLKNQYQSVFNDKEILQWKEFTMEQV